MYSSAEARQVDVIIGGECRERDGSQRIVDSRTVEQISAQIQLDPFGVRAGLSGVSENANPILVTSR
jgi:hypothetical protein